MTITFDRAPEDAARLSAIAALRGQSLNATAYALFTEALAQAVRIYEMAGEEIPLTPEEEIEAIRLGLEDSFAGRVTPLTEWSAKVRARHNCPEDTPVMTHKEAMLLP